MMEKQNKIEISIHNDTNNGIWKMMTDRAKHIEVQSKVKEQPVDDEKPISLPIWPEYQFYNLRFDDEKQSPDGTTFNFVCDKWEKIKLDK